MGEYGGNKSPAIDSTKSTRSSTGVHDSGVPPYEFLNLYGNLACRLSVPRGLETSFVEKAILVRAVPRETFAKMAEPRRTGVYRNPNLNNI
jgi:hypothetical protein